MLSSSCDCVGSGSFSNCALSCAIFFSLSFFVGVRGRALRPIVVPVVDMFSMRCAGIETDAALLGACCLGEFGCVCFSVLSVMWSIVDSVGGRMLGAMPMEAALLIRITFGLVGF